MPSDVFEAEVVMNYGGLVAYQATPSVLGQLVWSWMQFCPLFLTLYWLLDKVFAFLVREKIIKRRVVHDPDYLRMVEEENARKLKLRLS